MRGHSHVVNIFILLRHLNGFLYEICEILSSLKHDDKKKTMLEPRKGLILHTKSMHNLNHSCGKRLVLEQQLKSAKIKEKKITLCSYAILTFWASSYASLFVNAVLFAVFFSSLWIHMLKRTEMHNARSLFCSVSLI